MSGRLIILPKKTYCPWKPENVERVLRDERLERERLQREEDEQRALTCTQRLDRLKKSNNNDSSSSRQNEKEKEEEAKHVNLFEPEERAMLETAVTGGKQQQQSPDQTATRNQSGIMPVRLDSVVVNHKRNEPFYVRPTLTTPRNDSLTKERMDPMKQFSSVRRRRRHDEEESNNKNHAGDQEPHSSSDEIRKRRKHRKHSSRNNDSDSEDSKPQSASRRRRKGERKFNKKQSKTSKSVTIEELRKKREDRERKESQREAALRRDSSSRQQHGRYQDQFNPGLSRR